MKNKQILLLGGLIIIIFIGWYFLVNKQDAKVVISDPLNTTYLIGGESFTLVNGFVEKEITPESATKNKVSVFGEPVFGDIDKDGDDDAVLILVNDPGGSGTFYYAAIAANINGEYKGTDTILLGDRIVPQKFYIDDNRAKIEYLNREFGESFAIQPSVEKALHLKFEVSQSDENKLYLIEVEVDFEGEADPNIMTLDMHTWRWIKTTYNNDTELIPDNIEEFTITFKNDGTFSATTDCNSMGGSYEVEENKITFSDIFATEMFCEGSQEQQFSKMLGEVNSYFFTGHGELIFDLKFDSGSSIFR
ncbi:META domain-containing protein [Patescibacteria group bacterium]